MSTVPDKPGCAGQRQPRWTDHQVEQAVGLVLRAGVIIAAGVVLIGGIWYLVRHGDTAPDYQVFRGEPSDLRSIDGIVRDVRSLRARGIIQFGLLLLIATPVVRVALGVIAFAVQRDRIYVIVTVIVLAVLCYSLFAGYRV